MKCRSIIIFHGNNIIPHYIKDRYPLTPDIHRQRIEVIKKKNRF